MNQFFGYDLDWLEKRRGIHTAREITHQPKLWRTLTHDLTADQPLQQFLQPLLQNPQLRVILTGAGTSAFAGEALAPWLNQRTSLDVEAIATTDIVANPTQYLDPNKPTLLVSFARSGNSPESVAAVALADQLLPECYHLLLTCNPDGELARYADCCTRGYRVLMPEGSNDKSFAMTSSFSCMMLTALLLLDENCDTNQLAAMIELCENKIEAWQRPVKELAALDYKRLIYLGGGPFQGLAREAALKMMELSAGQVMTRHDSSLGFRHGPKFALNEEGIAVLFLSADPYTRQYDDDLLRELERDQLAMRVVALGGNDVEGQHALSLYCPTLSDGWLLFPYILFAQMLAFEKSLALGLTPDNPCPTGEVNRVVQGVTIYPYSE